MKQIIHLSDLHIGYGDLTRRFAAIVDNILYAMQPPHRYVVVVTGDLVDSAAPPSNFPTARRQLGRLEQAGFTVLVIPGNHDYGTGILGDKRYVRRFKEVFFGDPELEYPKLDLIEGTALIGLDSMAEELAWNDRLFAEGEIGQDQLKRTAALLNSRAVRRCRRRVIYLHHHPFDKLPFRQLKDAGSLGALLRRHADIDALLYGHRHVGRKANGSWGIPRCYDGGSATRKLGAAGAHRVIHLGRDPRLDFDGDFHGNG